MKSRLGEREWIDGVQRKRQKKGNVGRSRKHINNNDKRRLHETQVTNEDETMMLFFILSRSKRKNVFDLCIPFPQTRSLSCSILSSFNSTYFLAFFLFAQSFLCYDFFLSGVLDDAVLVEEVIVSDAWNGKRSSLRIVQVAGRVRGGFLKRKKEKG